MTCAGASGALGNTMKSLDVMARTGGARFTSLVIFSVMFFFLLCWWVVSRKSTV